MGPKNHTAPTPSPRARARYRICGPEVAAADRAARASPVPVDLPRWARAEARFLPVDLARGGAKRKGRRKKSKDMEGGWTMAGTLIRYMKGQRRERDTLRGGGANGAEGGTESAHAQSTEGAGERTEEGTQEVGMGRGEYTTNTGSTGQPEGWRECTRDGTREWE